MKNCTYYNMLEKQIVSYFPTKTDTMIITLVLYLIFKNINKRDDLCGVYDSQSAILSSVRI